MFGMICFKFQCFYIIIILRAVTPLAHLRKYAVRKGDFAEEKISLKILK